MNCLGGTMTRVVLLMEMTDNTKETKNVPLRDGHVCDSEWLLKSNSEEEKAIYCFRVDGNCIFQVISTSFEGAVNAISSIFGHRPKLELITTLPVLFGWMTYIQHINLFMQNPKFKKMENDARVAWYNRLISNVNKYRDRIYANKKLKEKDFDIERMRKIKLKFERGWSDQFVIKKYYNQTSDL